ncbi:MAG: trypsin-like peptidase domain-containing protein [Clostridia bacterium]|nr:trypsin-like peptidase domain-containing protein [Clostridia bacterium]
MKNVQTIRKLIALCAALALLVTAGVSAFAQDNGTAKHFSVIEAASDENALSIAEIVAKNRTSVVAIETETKIVYNDNYYNNPFGASPFGGLFGYGYGYGYGDGRRSPREYTQKAAGSGVIISDDGYIVTNNHVISGADKITVYVAPENDGDEEKSYEATLVGSSESNDIAVLKIEAEGLNPATFADSDQLQVGELAVVIGNPMGTVHGSVTAGIISAKEHSLTIDDVTINAIQTDAAINPGNSGGALFDSFGNMIGVVYAKASSVQIEGIGYAIPVNNVKTLIEQMINDPDSVQAQTDGSRIMLGITITDVTEAISKQYNMPIGVYITDVSSMSAAERAGLQRGDIITGFAGEKVTNADDLNAIKAKQTPGETVQIVVDRNGNELTLDLVVPQPTDVDTLSNNQRNP